MDFARNTRIALQFGENNPGQVVVNWEEYTFDSDFLIPCDAFSMKVGDKSITPEMRKFMQGGQKVQLFVQFLDDAGNILWQNPIFTGYLDKMVEETNSRNGTFFTLHGRNILGPLCDGGVDPWSNKYKFVEGQTLADVMGKVFDTFGITNFYLTDAKNRDIVTGVNKAYAKLHSKEIKVAHDDIIVNENGVEVVTVTTTTTVNEWIDPTNKYDLAEKTIKKLQPRHDMTFMQFVEEHLARFSLHCWAMADGSGVVIGAPDYLQEPLFNIVNRINGEKNNVIEGRIQVDFAAQPSLIIAKGYTGGGDLPNNRMKACKVNEFIGYPVTNEDGIIIGPIKNGGQYIPLPEINTVIKRFKGLVPLDPNVGLAQNYSQYFTPPSVPKVIYWDDEKSRTPDQLEAAVRRKMSEYQRHALKVHYTIEDHQQNGLVWKHNTIALVNDQILGIENQPFWIVSVSMKKSRSRGTTTDLTLIPLGTLQLGPP